jgi:hypothetical protein
MAMKWLDKTLLNALQWWCDKTGRTKFFWEKWALIMAMILILGASMLLDSFSGIIIAVFSAIFTACYVQSIESSEILFLEHDIPLSSVFLRKSYRIATIIMCACIVALSLLTLVLLSVENNLPRLIAWFLLLGAMFLFAAGYFAACIPRVKPT